jgi:LCP family protein required for cell wall assembly
MHHKMSGKKKAVVIFGIIAGVLAIFVLTGYLIIDSYVSKVHYDPGTTKIVSSIAPEDVKVRAESSTQSEIEDANARIEKNMKNNSEPLMYDQDVFNILLIGSDTRSSGGNGRSDTMILVSINKKTQKIVETSLLRDMYVGIPGVSNGTRLNAAYAYGGADLLMKTIEQNFKIKVEKYASVDFFSFMNLIDRVGGVPIDISADEVRVANDYVKEINHLKGLPKDSGLYTKTGEQTVDGKKALAYARIRYVGNADWGRTDRQRIVLNQLFSKLKSLNLIQLNDMLNSFLPEVRTNLSKGELFTLLLSLPTYSNYQVVSWHVPESGSYYSLHIGGNDMLGVYFDKVIAQMKEKIYG